MLSFLLGLLAIGLYGCGTLYQALIYFRRQPPRAALTFALGASALISHLFATLHTMLTPQGIDLSLTNSLSLTAALIVLSLLVLSWRKPLQNLMLFVYPLAAACVLGLLLIDHAAHRYSPSNTGIYLHILLSILAYSASSIAAAQGILILLQNNNLKRRNSTILSRNLPPLLTMERLLFEIIRLACALLLTSVVTGAVFIDDFFAQKLAHKTVFTFAALLIFCTILVGRSRYGWRGTSASAWAIAGCMLLMTGYFGSKFVLEWVLHQPMPN